MENIQKRVYLKVLEVKIDKKIEHQNKVVMFLDMLDKHNILTDLEFAEVEDILNLSIECSKEYLNILNKIKEKLENDM